MDNLKEKLRNSKVKSIAIKIAVFILFITAMGLSNDNNKLSKQIEALSNDNEYLQNSVKDLTDKISEYEQADNSYEDDLSKLQSQISELEGYRDTYQDLENQYNDLNAGYSDINSKYEALQAENESLQIQVQGYAEQISNINASTITSQSDDNNTSLVETDSYEVYITKTGSKYHRGSCSYLKQSKIGITKSDAIAQGYTACSRCNP